MLVPASFLLQPASIFAGTDVFFCWNQQMDDALALSMLQPATGYGEDGDGRCIVGEARGGLPRSTTPTNKVMRSACWREARSTRRLGTEKALTQPKRKETKSGRESDGPADETCLVLALLVRTLFTTGRSACVARCHMVRPFSITQ